MSSAVNDSFILEVFLKSSLERGMSLRPELRERLWILCENYLFRNSYFGSSAIGLNQCLVIALLTILMDLTNIGILSLDRAFRVLRNLAVY